MTEGAINAEDQRWAESVKLSLRNNGYRPRAWSVEGGRVEAVLQKKTDIFATVLFRDTEPVVDPIIIKNISGLYWVDEVKPYDKPIPEATMYCGEAIGLRGRGNIEDLVRVYHGDAALIAGAYKAAKARLAI